MTPITLNEEQYAAVHCQSNNYTVLAAAGSGKTTVLVEKFLYYLDQGLTPEQILTITFTRKAAAEMKSRIVHRLRSSGRAEDAQLAETGPIQTIHGFCERLLRENALVIGLDAEFKVLEGSETQVLVEESIRSAILSADDQYVEAQELVRELAGEPSFENAGFYGKLRQEILQVLHKLRGSGHRPLALLADYRSHQSTLDRWKQFLLESQEIGDSTLNRIRSVSPEVLPSELARLFDKKSLPSWLRYTDVDTIVQSSRRAAGLLQLTLLTWVHLESAMLGMQALDFTMLESQAVRSVEDIEALRRRVQLQYHAVLVDEAQDLNPVQYRLLQGLGISNQMLVGDPQQSIYRFRLADRQLLVTHSEKNPTLRLTKNYRSLPAIRNYVDLVFGKTWSPNYAPIGESTPTCLGASTPGIGVEHWQLAAMDFAVVADLIEQQVANLGMDSMAVLVRKSESAYRIANELTKRGIPSRIIGGAQRFFTKLEVRDVANLLDAVTHRERGLSYLSLLRSPFVGLSMDAIVMLTPREGAPMALDESITDADQLQLKKFREWFDPLTTYADRLPAWEVLAYALKHSPFLENLARLSMANQRIANVRKLLRMATQPPELGPNEFAQQIREVQALLHKEGEAAATDLSTPAVTIMTIHKAKGLEFDTVIVPETLDRRRDRNTGISVDGPGGIVTVATQRHAYHDLAKYKEKTLDIEEEQRVLYVAMTRARRKLCVVTAQGSEPCLGSFIRQETKDFNILTRLTNA